MPQDDPGTFPATLPCGQFLPYRTICPSDISPSHFACCQISVTAHPAKLAREIYRSRNGLNTETKLATKCDNPAGDDAQIVANDTRDDTAATENAIFLHQYAPKSMDINAKCQKFSNDSAL